MGYSPAPDSTLMPQILLRLETALPLLKARLLPDGVTLDNAAQDGVIDVKLCICQVVSSVLDNWREAVSQMVFSTFAGVLTADEGAVIAPTSSGVVSSIVQNVAHAGEIHRHLRSTWRLRYQILDMLRRERQLAMPAVTDALPRTVQYIADGSRSNKV